MTSATSERTANRAWNPLDVLNSDIAGVDETVSETTRAYLIFKLRGQWLAASVSQVREILDDQPVTPLPNAPHDVEGMIDVRGKGVTIVDLAQHLGISPHTDDPPERIVVLEFERADAAPLAIGVRTETVRDVCQINEARIETPPEALSNWDQSMILGVTRVEERIIILIDLSTIVGKCTQNDEIFVFS